MVVLAVVAAIVMVAVVTIEVAPRPAPAAVHQVDGISIHLAGQGRTSTGRFWFGYEYLNYSGRVNGYPYSYAPGQAIDIPIVLVQADVVNHTIGSATIAPPFTLQSVDPTFPAAVSPGDLMVRLEIEPPTAPGSYTAMVTLQVSS